MKIDSIQIIEYVKVYIGEEVYTRHSADKWSLMYCGLEEFYDIIDDKSELEELEEAYQHYLSLPQPSKGIMR